MQYHLYCLDERGQVRIDEWFDADSDEDAIALVRSMKRPFDCELWDNNNRQLARLPRPWTS